MKDKCRMVRNVDTNIESGILMKLYKTRLAAEQTVQDTEIWTGSLLPKQYTKVTAEPAREDKAKMETWRKTILKI